jgi:phosphoserine phosphatase RsbU/P
MLSATFSAIFLQTSAFSDIEWRWAIFTAGIAFILLTIGLSALAVYLFRRSANDRAALYFGVFVVLYAVRMFLREPPILSLIAIPPGVSSQVDHVITFCIGIPALLIFLQVMEKRWKAVFQWALGVSVVFAVVAIVLAAFGYARNELLTANNILVLALWLLLTIFLFAFHGRGRLPIDLRVLRVGLAIYGLFVVHANLASLGILPGRDLEPVGFLVFVFTLGYFVTHRIFAQGESLLAIQKELEIAEQIQTSILPRAVPQLAGVHIAARYIPMSAVAGDFYDFLQLDGNRLGILVADVTGHGVPAALIASMLKVAFAVQTANAEYPERVLNGLNRALCGKFESHFVTAAYLYADLDAKIVRYAGAGHPPLLFSDRAEKQTRAIEENGLILGMFEEATYTALEMPLRVGDRYVLYTDGLPESKNGKEEEFGTKRCEQYLESHADASTEKLADGLLGEIAQWSTRAEGRLQEDDMTLVIIDCQ